MFQLQEVAAVLVAALFIFAVPFGGMLGAINPSPPECSTVAGTVVNKDSGDDGYVIHVLLDDAYADESEGYIVHVGNTTYESYMVGDSYAEIVCNLDTYTEIRQFIDDLTSLGLVELSG